ncbi:MAG: hypothetical protein VB050_09605 [Geobacteraceae bacterium]|nr:hypothetical protein [Geobacteraceae bacterium]
MKRLVLMVAMLITTIALYGLDVQAAGFPYSKVIEVPGASKEQVLEKLRTWSGNYADTYNVDDKTGTVTSTGVITYPSPPIDRIQYTIAFEMKNTVQGGKDTVTFDKVVLKSPTTYMLESGEKVAGVSVPVKDERDIAAATNRLNYVADNLETYLQGKSTVACPLVKCPECPVLGTTSEELKGHMKEHMKTE